MGILILPIIRIFAWCFFLLPRKTQKGLVNGFAWFLEKISWKDQTIRRNFDLVFSEKSSQDFQKLKKGFYQHFASLVFEILFLAGPMKWMVKKRSQVVHGVENWRKAHEQGKGVLYLSCHVGNWEVMAATGAGLGMDLMIVTKHLKPEWVHRAIEKGRARCGVKGTYEPQTLKEAMKHLKKGGTVGFVLDQYAGPPVGIRVPFLGQVVGTGSIVATLAKRFGTPVVPVVNYRTEEGDFVSEIYPALEWISHPHLQKELALNTALYAKTLERFVLEHPDQWLWSHQRFKGDLSPLRSDEWEEGRARPLRV